MECLLIGCVALLPTIGWHISNQHSVVSCRQRKISCRLLIGEMLVAPLYFNRNSNFYSRHRLNNPMSRSLLIKYLIYFPSWYNIFCFYIKFQLYLDDPVFCTFRFRMTSNSGCIELWKSLMSFKFKHLLLFTGTLSLYI